MADYLVILHELDTTKSAEATSVRDKVVGEFETYVGIIGNRRHECAQLLDCLLSSTSVSSNPPFVESVAKKVEY